MSLYCISCKVYTLSSAFFARKHGFTSYYWSYEEVSDKFCILHCLHPPSDNWYQLVAQIQGYTSVLARCIGTYLARGKASWSIKVSIAAQKFPTSWVWQTVRIVRYHLRTQDGERARGGEGKLIEEHVDVDEWTPKETLLSSRIYFNMNQINIKSDMGTCCAADICKCKCKCRGLQSEIPMSSVDYNLHPWYWNSLLYRLISSGENSVHFLQLMPFTIFSSFHYTGYPSLLGGLRQYGMRGFAQHVYTWINFSDLMETG